MQLLWNESLAGGKSSLVFGQGEEKMRGEILEQELKQIRDKKKKLWRDRKRHRPLRGGPCGTESQNEL